MEPQIERRRHPRFQVSTTAVVCRGDQYVGQYVVRQLSGGGALLSEGPPVEVGMRIRILLRWPPRRCLALDADVVRHLAFEGGDATLAVAFRNVSPAVEDRIQTALLSLLEHGKRAAPPTVLVVDDSPRVRSALVRELRALGHRAVCASGPTEAIASLQQLDGTIEVALADLFLGDADGLDLLAYMGQHHPEVRRILMSGQARPAQLILARAQRQADAVLAKPWSREKLTSALAL